MKSLLAAGALGALTLSAPALADGVLQQWQGASFNDVARLNGYEVIPPDMGGSVGGGYVTQLINGAYTVWNTAGGQQTQISDSSFWLNAGVSPALVGTGLSDPRIIFDPGTNRWFASEITIGNGFNANNVLLAVSNTSNPLDGFKAVSIASSPGEFADFPTLGVNGTSVTIGTNNFSTNLDGVSIFSIPKADLVSGSPSLANMTRFDNLPYTNPGWTPQGVTGPTSASSVLSVDIFGGGDITLSKINGAGGPGATLSSPTVISTGGSGYPSDGRQPAAPGIDPGDNRISSGPVQVGNDIFFTRSVAGVSGDAVQWGVIDATTGTIVNQGLIQASNLDYLYPSIAANASGGFVIAFNGSGPSQNISDYWVSCTVGGGCGAPQLALAGTVDDYFQDFGYGVNRWGDYSWATVDPSNPNIFWLFQEYPLTGDQWGTVVTEIGLEAAAVPEAPIWAMMLLGFAGIGLAGVSGGRKTRSAFRPAGT